MFIIVIIITIITLRNVIRVINMSGYNSGIVLCCYETDLARDFPLHRTALIVLIKR